MATLNLKEMKWIDETALRIIISTGLGFASRIQTLENKEIEEFTPDKLYEKGSKVLYNDYLWVAKVTNQSATFNENFWTLIGDDITELTLDEIKTFLGLTQEQIDTLASIIVDTEIRLDKTWSSSKTYSDIQDAIKECKQYCITELAKKSTGSFKKVNSTSEVTDGNYLYLILNSSTNKYDIYALVDSNVELLTSVDVNLSDYYTKTEINNDFLKKTDATSTYATKTEANDKVDKANILSSISSTATDDNLYSAKLINGELNKKLNANELVVGDKGEWSALQCELTDGSKSYRLQIDKDGNANIFTSTDNWSTYTFKKVCTTKVADVNNVDINVLDSTNCSVKEYFRYSIKNGIAIIDFGGIQSSKTPSTLLAEVPFISKNRALVNLTNANGNKVIGLVYINAITNKIYFNVGVPNEAGYGQMICILE